MRQLRVIASRADATAEFAKDISRTPHLHIDANIRAWLSRCRIYRRGEICYVWLTSISLIKSSITRARWPQCSYGDLESKSMPLARKSWVLTWMKKYSSRKKPIHDLSDAERSDRNFRASPKPSLLRLECDIEKAHRVRSSVRMMRSDFEQRRTLLFSFSTALKRGQYLSQSCESIARCQHRVERRRFVNHSCTRPG